MLCLARNHPHFDLDLEVLAMIPPEPRAVPVAIVAADLGCTGQSRIRKSLEMLRAVGIKTLVHSAHGYRVAIARECWPQAKKMAERYLETVEAQ